jgi:hypothetical protein
MRSSVVITYVIGAALGFGICGSVTGTLVDGFCNDTFCHNWILHFAALPFALLCCAFFSRRIGGCLLVSVGISFTWLLVCLSAIFLLWYPRISAPYGMCICGAIGGMGTSLFCELAANPARSKGRTLLSRALLGGIIGVSRVPRFGLGQSRAMTCNSYK